MKHVRLPKGEFSPHSPDTAGLAHMPLTCSEWEGTSCGLQVSETGTHLHQAPRSLVSVTEVRCPLLPPPLPFFLSLLLFLQFLQNTGLICQGFPYPTPVPQVFCGLSHIMKD